MNLLSPETIRAMLDLYESGKRVKDVAETFGCSTGKAYYILRNAGCHFRRQKFTEHHTEEARRKIGERHKGKCVSAETRKKQSEAKKCHYDGLNGCGHLKQHASGYVLAYVPDHPHATSDGYVFLHTVVMERSIGRYLNNDEVVHHINRIKNDNRLENLVLMNKHEHMSMHMKERYAKRRNDLLIV